MGVTILKSTMPDAVTPICNDCGITLCYDVGECEYQLNKIFWDDWKCKECNPQYLRSYKKYKEHNKI